jgi:hypothetical protein
MKILVDHVVDAIEQEQFGDHNHVGDDVDDVNDDGDDGGDGDDATDGDDGDDATDGKEEKREKKQQKKQKKKQKKTKVSNFKPKSKSKIKSLTVTMDKATKVSKSKQKDSWLPSLILLFRDMTIETLPDLHRMVFDEELFLWTHLSIRKYLRPWCKKIKRGFNSSIFEDSQVTFSSLLFFYFYLFVGFFFICFCYSF